MPRRTPLPQALIGRAFTREDALELGVSRGRLRATDLTHPHHGSYSEGLDADALSERCRALLPVLHEHQAFSHLTAARLYGLPLPRPYSPNEELHVITRADAPPMRRPGVVGWETERHIEFLEVDGLPLAAPVEVWTQLAVLASRRRAHGLAAVWLLAVGDALVSGTRTDRGRSAPLAVPTELRAASLRHRGQRGAKALRWAVPLVRTGVDSPKETELRLGLMDFGLPEPETQVAVLTPEGWRHADLGYPDHRVLLEYQGDEHRSSRQRWMRDLRRVQLFEDAGYRCILVSAADLFPDCAALAARVDRALSAARETSRMHG